MFLDCYLIQFFYIVVSKNYENMNKLINLASLLVIPLITILLFAYSLKINEEKNEKHRSDALNALQFLTELRAYPNNDILPEKYYNAFIEYDSRLYKKSNLSLPVWTSMGPTNVPGRMISLAVNPKNSKTLYAGSATGGLWRTFNSTTGSNWHRIQTGFPVLGVMAIAIDPIDTNVIYIGTGEVYGYKTSVGGYVIRTTRGSYGIGILKTTDAGMTWNKSLDWSAKEQRGIQKLALNPKDNRVLYAGTTEGTYKSTNKGLTWNRIHSSPMVEDIIVNPSDTNMVLISCGNLFSINSGIYYSLDAGKNWTKSDFPIFTGKTLLDYYEANPNYIFASVGDSEKGKGLYRSNDFGKTWNMAHNQNVQDYQGFFSHWVAVHPKDINKVIHAGVNMYKSQDGGVNLKTISGLHVDHHNFAHDPNDPNVIYVANDGGVYRSADFGETYKNIGTGLITSQFYNGFSSSEQDSSFAIGGLQDNNSVIFSGSKSWRTVIGGDGCWALVNPQNDQNVFGSSQYNRINRSTNRGQTFVASTSGMTADAAFASPYCISFTNSNIMYSGRKIVYRSIDNGLTWKGTNGNSMIDGNFVLAMDIARNDENYVFITTAPTNRRAGVFVTTDAGNNWSNVTGTLPDRYPMDIAIDPIDKYKAYVVFGGYDSPHVYKTLDGGINWINITGNLPDVPTLAIVVDPFDTSNIYVGNDLGVYFSINGGNSWEPLNQGLPEAVMAMDLSISKKNRKLRLATHGNGVYQIPLISNKKGYIDLIPINFPSQVLVGNKNDFSVEIENKGIAEYKDSVLITFQIQNANKEQVFSESKAVSLIKPNSKLKVELGKNYTFTNAGDYRINYIKTFVNKLQNPEFISFSVTVKLVPKFDMLVNNYPNPFNSQTWIEYNLANDSQVNLRLFDISGSQAADLVNSKQTTGYYKVKLDAAALRLSSGVYILNLRTSSSSRSIKVVYLK